MGNKESTASKSGDVAKAVQSSAHSKGATPGQQINVRMVQNVLLIWLDNKIDNTSADCRNTISQLRCAVNDIKTFTDGEECIQFIETITDNKACMIISGALGEQIVPRAHHMSQVDSIFIFCGNKKYHEQWTKKWSKIKGVFTDITPICEALKKAAQQCEQNAIPMSFVDTSGDQSQNKLEPSFMYTQILKEILLTITFEPQHIEQFIAHCRDVLAADNKDQLENVTKLERTYRDKTPIWWYTFECFLYRMLNQVLRQMDVDVIIKMGFFIGDLHRHIEQLHKEQFGDGKSKKNFEVYRGQGMSKVDFEQLTKTKGGLMSFNNFLSTSKDREVSLKFARFALPNQDMVGVLFVMTIHPSKSTTPFACITDVSYLKMEEEVLFAMHTVFRIGEITPMGENHRLFQVDLILTSDNDSGLLELTDRIREETFPGQGGWERLGLVLLKMGESEKAQQVYEILLEQATEESGKAPIYNNLGLIKYNQGEYQEAITFYEKVLEIYKKTPNHPDLAKSYINLGSTYSNTGDNSRARVSYEKAIDIQQRSHSTNDSNLAMPHEGLGLVYYNMGDYSKALSSYEKALAIKEQSLPPNHPDLGSSYNNIGVVYRNMGDYSKALSFYEKALAIKQQSLPPNHPDLAASYNNIGNVYNNMGDYSKALSYYEKDLEISQKSLPPNHPDLAASYNNIGMVYDSMGDSSKALSSYEKALAIQQQSLPPNHPSLGGSYNNIGLVYRDMGEYSKALSSYEKALAIKQQSLPPNHPSLGGSYNNIGSLYGQMGEHAKALPYFEKTLAIQQQSLPPNHPDLGMSYNNIGVVYEEMGDYSKARSFCERAVEIGQQSLPPNHPNRLKWQKHLEDIK